MRNPATISEDRTLRLRNGIFPSAALILLFAVALLPGCSRQGDAVAPSPDMMTAPVTAMTATKETVPVEVHAIGNVEAFSTVTVKSQVEGVIEQVHFTEGQDVHKDDLLFNIDARPFEARLQQAEANMARDQAQAKNARAQAARNKNLFEAGIVSQDQYDQFATSADALLLAVQFPLRPADVVFVSTSELTRWSRVMGQILPTIQGLWQTYDVAYRTRLAVLKPDEKEREQ